MITETAACKCESPLAGYCPARDCIACAVCDGWIEDRPKPTPAPFHNLSNDWFVTASGGKFWPTAAKPEHVNIDDIAHALANVCRFGGHGKFYSVAQHSVLVSQIVPQDLRFVALMHDATEAYIGDMVRPLKYQIPQFIEIEDQLWKVIAEKFGLPSVIPPEIKKADEILLMTERRDVLPWHEHKWVQDGTVELLPERIYPWFPEDAKRAFLDRFYFLKK